MEFRAVEGVEPNCVLEDGVLPSVTHQGFAWAQPKVVLVETFTGRLCIKAFGM